MLLLFKKELPVLRFARESVVAKTKIRKYEIFSEKNLTTKRPNTGQIPAKNFYKILGKKAKKDIPEYFNNSRFKIVEASYGPLLLSPVIFLVRTMQRIRLKLFPNR